MKMRDKEVLWKKLIELLLNEVWCFTLRLSVIEMKYFVTKRSAKNLQLNSMIVSKSQLEEVINHRWNWM